MKIEKLADTDVIEVRSDVTLLEMLALIRQYHRADFPVVNDESSFVGMVYEENLMLWFSREGLLAEEESVRLAAGTGLKLETVNAVVQKLAWSADEHADPEDVARRMQAEGLRVVPLIKQGKVAGLLYRCRLLEYLAGQWIEKTPRPVVAEADHAGAPEDLRFFERVDVKLPVAYKLEGREASGLQIEARIAETVNLSAGGLLMRSREKLPAGSNVSLAVDLFKNGQPLKVLARVIRCSASTESSSYDTGILFLGLTMEDRKKIDQVVKSMRGGIR